MSLAKDFFSARDAPPAPAPAPELPASLGVDGIIEGERLLAELEEFEKGEEMPPKNPAAAMFEEAGHEEEEEEAAAEGGDGGSHGGEEEEEGEGIGEDDGDEEYLPPSGGGGAGAGGRGRKREASSAVTSGGSGKKGRKKTSTIQQLANGINLIDKNVDIKQTTFNEKEAEFKAMMAADDNVAAVIKEVMKIIPAAMAKPAAIDKINVYVKAFETWAKLKKASNELKIEQDSLKVAAAGFEAAKKAAAEAAAGNSQVGEFA